jgi:hypothetical protein
VLERWPGISRATAEILQRIGAAMDRAEQIGELWLAAHPGADRLRYSAHARLQARLASMPVIEQARASSWPGRAGRRSRRSMGLLDS